MSSRFIINLHGSELFQNNQSGFAHTDFEVKRLNMDKKSQKQLEEQKNHNKFNSITEKVTPENQNQTHNCRKEGLQPINQKR